MEPEIADAFGMTLAACLDVGALPGQAHEVVERDDGQIGVGDAARYFAPPEGETASWVFERIRGRLLDIGAGAGRYAIAAQQLGREVVALDVSEGALDVCRARGVVETYLGTVTDLAATASSPFDSFLLMGNNLGLLGAPAQAGGFLEALDTLAADGARIIAQGTDASLTEDPEHLRYHDWNRGRGRHPHLVRLRVRFDRYATDWFEYLMPSPDDLAEILEPTAWTIDEIQRMSAPSAGSYVVTLRRR